MVTAGITQAPAPRAPKLGSQPSVTENTSTSSAATKKFGVEAPTRGAPCRMRSSAPPLLAAPASLAPTDSASASTPPCSSSAPVTGMRAANSSAIGLPVRSDTPKSPPAAAPSQRA